MNCQIQRSRVPRGPAYRLWPRPPFLAGDAFRAAFAVALCESRPLDACMLTAAAAGAIAVSRPGAVPSLPHRAETEALAAAHVPHLGSPVASPAPSVSDGGSAGHLRGGGGGGGDRFPLEFASRLNSMKDRLDLWDGANDVEGWVARQGTVSGLGLVDFNYPQHLSALSYEQARQALARAGLRAGAVCMRYPKEMQAGALTNPDAALRARAIELTKEGCEWARELGATELCVWSAYDGYDYCHQADFVEMWRRVVLAFQEVCDAYPDIKVSLEFKPTDENTRWFAVPSTGAALLLAHEVDRHNFGLTLDFGHCIAAGENPAQSVAMVGAAGKLFGVQLNDGYGRLGAEDGLMFGSVHPEMALEFVRWLQKVGFSGHVYFDTFPRNEDPVREAEYNIRTFKRLWARAHALADAGIDELARRQDALGLLELLHEG